MKSQSVSINKLLLSHLLFLDKLTARGKSSQSDLSEALQLNREQTASKLIIKIWLQFKKGRKTYHIFSPKLRSWTVVEVWAVSTGSTLKPPERTHTHTHTHNLNVFVYHFSALLSLFFLPFFHPSLLSSQISSCLLLYLHISHVISKIFLLILFHVLFETCRELTYPVFHKTMLTKIRLRRVKRKQIWAI